MKLRARISQVGYIRDRDVLYSEIPRRQTSLSSFPLSFSRQTYIVDKFGTHSHSFYVFVTQSNRALRTDIGPETNIRKQQKFDWLEK